MTTLSIRKAVALVAALAMSGMAIPAMGADVNGPTAQGTDGTSAVTNVALPGTENESAGPIAVYDFEDGTGANAVDGVGGLTLSGAAAVVDDDDRGKVLRLDGSDGTYASFPRGLFDGCDRLTVQMDVHSDANQWNATFAFGQDSTRYYFMKLWNSGVISSRITTVGGEANEAKADGTVTADVWHRVTIVLDGTTMTLYADGTKVNENTDTGVTVSDLGDDTLGYLGKSFFNDPYFRGSYDNVRVWNRALDAGEIADASVDTLWQGVTPRDSRVVDAVELPSVNDAGDRVTWRSGDPSLLCDDGTVAATPDRDTDVTLTASIVRAGRTYTKDFTVTVLCHDSAIRAELEAIAIPGLDDVRGNITLPVTGAYGSPVTWTASPAGVISTTTRHSDGKDIAPGEVTRQKRDTKVTLTAAIDGRTRTFEARVKARPERQETRGYLFAYFTGDSDDDCKVRYSLSQGNDILSYRTLNDDRPVFESTLGQKGLRDPFIMRSHEGDRFYALATDLLGSPGSSGQNLGVGSQYLEVWESDDLVHWGNQRHVKVSPDNAGNTWAPEAYWDDSRGEYMVFWASNLYEGGETDAYNSYNRMMYATTRDFVTFSPAQVWMDEKQPGRGNGTIDSDVIEEDGWYYRATVPEAEGVADENHKGNPRVDRTRDLRNVITPENDPWLGRTGSGWEAMYDNIGYGQEYVSVAGNRRTLTLAEGTSLVRPNRGDVNLTEQDGPNTVFAFIDQAGYYGGDGYVPLKASSMAKGDWTVQDTSGLPASPRHGTVLPVTAEEYNALLRAYQPDQLLDADEVAVTTDAGTAPQLPDTVDVTRGVGESAQPLGAQPVVWDAIDPESYAEAGTFAVTGTMADPDTGAQSGFVTAVVTVR